MRNLRTSPGLTLLEVVAALALLATLLVAILTAHDRLARQRRLAERRLRAIEAADRLLTEWTSRGPMQVPAAEGTIEGPETLRWRVTARMERPLEPLNVQIATLSLFDQSIGPRDAPALVSVEFFTSDAIETPFP